MEQRYKMALELIKVYIEKETYLDKNTINAMCESALMRDRIELAEEREGDCDVYTRLL
jgi:hypothetical protein